MSTISSETCPVWAPLVGFTGVMFALVFASECIWSSRRACKSSSTITTLRCTGTINRYIAKGKGAHCCATFSCSSGHLSSGIWLCRESGRTLLVDVLERT